jgi:cell division transport system permease protein
MPAVIDVRLGEPAPEMTSLAARLDAAAPGTLTESHGGWAHRLTVLARSLQAATGAALLVVTMVAAAVVCVATRAGLAVRREAIEIVHGLGATAAYIAGPFAWRAMTLAGFGGVIGAACALPVLLCLAYLIAPFSGLPSGKFVQDTSGAVTIGVGLLSALPVSLWACLPFLPLAGAAIGWVTAQATVRRWLRCLP